MIFVRPYFKCHKISIFFLRKIARGKIIWEIQLWKFHLLIFIFWVRLTALLPSKLNENYLYIVLIHIPQRSFNLTELYIELCRKNLVVARLWICLLLFLHFYLPVVLQTLVIFHRNLQIRSAIHWQEHIDSYWMKQLHMELLPKLANKSRKYWIFV